METFLLYMPLTYGYGELQFDFVYFTYSGTPLERPPPLERPHDTVNININVLISTPDEGPPL